MRQQLSLFGASFLAAASLASAGPITYDVTINTSSISGTDGSLDFNFNPGLLVTQSASLRSSISHQMVRLLVLSLRYRQCQRPTSGNCDVR
jgi:hypothetical protein